MSKLGKVTTGLAMFLLMAGGLLALTGWFMGGHTSIEYTRNDHTIVVTPFGVRWGRDTRSNQPSVMGNVGAIESPVEAFTDLTVDVPMADIYLQEGDAYGIALEWSNQRCAMDYRVEDGLLKVWALESGSIGWLGDWDHEATVTITYPASAKLDKVDLRAGMGDVDVAGLTAQELTLSADMGSVFLADAKLGKAELTVDMGELAGHELEISGLTKATASMGSIELSGNLRDMDLNCDMGSITVYTNLSQSEYRYDLSVDMGVLTYGRTEAIGGEMSGGKGSYSIQADCSMGNLEIYFDA